MVVGGELKIFEIFLIMGVLFPQSSCGGSRDNVLPREMTKNQRSRLTTVGFSYFDFWKKEIVCYKHIFIVEYLLNIRKKNKIQTYVSCIDNCYYSDT